MEADHVVARTADRTKQPRTDFRRRVYCLLGLPIDGVRVGDAVRIVSAASPSRCILSTPNVNIVLGSHRDPGYRDSLIRTDLSVADGMPLVLVARLLGVPIRERVAGSTLFETLLRGEGGSMEVYFFGGPDGAAQVACDRLNALSGPLHCVGATSPGFGSIEQMSRPEAIEHINRSGAEFLIVAIAAKKAQLWIEHNHRALEPHVMGALGALVNLVSGRISRAPVFMQKAGLEWLWRIKEEPALWRRYLTDGLALLRLLLTRVLPAVALRMLDSLGRPGAPAYIAVNSRGERILLTLAGEWSAQNLSPLRDTLEKVTVVPRDVDVDLSKVDRVDQAFIGLLMLLYAHQSKVKRAFRIVSASKAARRTLHLNCAEFLFEAAPGGRTARLLTSKSEI